MATPSINTCTYLVKNFYQQSVWTLPDRCHRWEIFPPNLCDHNLPEFTCREWVTCTTRGLCIRTCRPRTYSCARRSPLSVMWVWPAWARLCQGVFDGVETRTHAHTFTHTVFYIFSFFSYETECGRRELKIQRGRLNYLAPEILKELAPPCPLNGTPASIPYSTASDIYAFG